MKLSAADITEIFATLGDTIDRTLTSALRAEAVRRNDWFSLRSIDYAIDALRRHMLDRAATAGWLKTYPTLPAPEPLNVAVVAAGNIPLVGFFDMMCTLASGNRCLLKLSGKDDVLLGSLADELKERFGLPVDEFNRSDNADALIASGDDSTMNTLRLQYGSMPMLLRGHRSSIALLDGSESDEKLTLLGNDIFLYNSLGCRNVTLVFIPEDFDPNRLVKPIGRSADLVNAKYANNYRQTSALLAMTGRQFVDGGFFVLCGGDDFPDRLARINYCRYGSLAEVEEWMRKNDERIQCVVTECADHPRRCGFGCAQRPTLYDYPDGKDTMAFLAALHQ